MGTFTGIPGSGFGTHGKRPHCPTSQCFPNIAVEHIGTGTHMSDARHSMPAPHVLRESEPTISDKQ